MGVHRLEAQDKNVCLLCIVGELACEVSVAVAVGVGVGVGDRRHVTYDRWHLSDNL